MAYLPYLEEARVEYLRAIGHPYDAVRGGEAGDAREFPVLEVSVQYRQPLHFDDDVDVSLRIGAVRGATFQYAYLWRGCRSAGNRGDGARMRGWKRAPLPIAGMGGADRGGPRRVDRPGVLRRTGAVPCRLVSGNERIVHSAGPGT